MFQEMLAAGSGGGGGLDVSYKLLGVARYDSTSKNITVPANTDFIIVNTYTLNSDTTIDISSSPATIEILKNVGETVQSAGTYASGGYISNAQTFEWVSATSLSQTRASASGWVTYYFCQYV